ncbi:MAG: exodeoxyribonuclease VII large subunit, partial [Gammaproteobacteria bacterium]
MDNSFTRRDIYNVTRLNREVRTVLEGSFPSLWVQGEISNLAQPASGHLYFSLKDDFSQVRCAMFQNRKRAMEFKPEQGMSVLVRANVSMYETRGEYQLIVEYMEPAGAGELQRAFEEMKQRLYREG